MVYCWTNVWPNNNPKNGSTSSVCWDLIHLYNNALKTPHSQHACAVGSMLDHCWASVAYGGPTLIQHRVTVSYLLRVELVVINRPSLYITNKTKTMPMVRIQLFYIHLNIHEKHNKNPMFHNLYTCSSDRKK